MHEAKNTKKKEWEEQEEGETTVKDNKQIRRAINWEIEDNAK